ncbi:MAG: hypothetical protein IVW57_02860 [Ktedonobacterales bacterium]|nr:hypothetical protein [Ktedonobacterales bacterium]
MKMADPAHNPITQARERYDLLCEAYDALVAQFAALPTDERGDAATTLRARVRASQCARDEAHLALGHALLDQFVGEVAHVTAGTRQAWRAGDLAATREALHIERTFRQACLAALSAWPTLAAEAKRRLAAPPAPNERTLH